MNEPTVTIAIATEHTVPCPYCHEHGTHLGTCHLSLMRSGRIWAITAKPVDWQATDPAGTIDT